MDAACAIGTFHSAAPKECHPYFKGQIFLLGHSLGGMDAGGCWSKVASLTSPDWVFQNLWWIYIYNIILGDLQSWSPFSLVDYSYPSGVILWDIVMEKRLSFTPSALFMLGSPLGVFLHTGYGVAGSHALCKKLGKAWSSNAFLHVNSFPFKLRGNLFTTFSAFQNHSHFIVRIAYDDIQLSLSLHFLVCTG